MKDEHTLSLGLGGCGGSEGECGGALLEVHELKLALQSFVDTELGDRE